jgi:hypothetical protein
MAATTNINRYTGAATAQVAVDVTAGLKITRDDSNTGTTAIPIPTSTGTVFSQELVLGLGVTGTGGNISNRRLSLTGALPTGMHLWQRSASDATYVQGVAGTTLVPQAASTNDQYPNAGYSSTELTTSLVVYDAASVASTVTTNTAPATANGEFIRVVLGVDALCSLIGTNSAGVSLQLTFDEG